MTYFKELETLKALALFIHSKDRLKILIELIVALEIERKQFSPDSSKAIVRRLSSKLLDLSWNSDQYIIDSIHEDIKSLDIETLKKLLDFQYLQYLQCTLINLGEIHIYCGAHCFPNSRESASGIAIYNNEALLSSWYGLYEAEGTNNKAELYSILHALKFIESDLDCFSSIKITSQSEYAIKCISVWSNQWKNRGWSRRRGSIANLELIKEAHELYEKLTQKHPNRICIEYCPHNTHIEGISLAHEMAELGLESKSEDLCLFREDLGY